MSIITRLTPAAAAVLLLASCGGGSVSPPPGTASSTDVSTSGWVVDGYLNGATVLCDSNGNGQTDAGEVTVFTNAGGLFTFPQGCNASLTAKGGTDTDTNLPFKGLMKAPAGATVITPLTTLMVAGMSQLEVNTVLGLPAATNLMTTDPALKSGGSLVNGELMRRSVAIQLVLQRATELFAGLAGAAGDAVLQAIYNEVALSMAASMKSETRALGTGTTLDQAVIAGMIKSAALRVADAAAVSNDVKTALKALNADALAQVAAGAFKAQAEALLKAADADIAATAKTQLGDDRITSFVVANKAQLGSAPDAATAALGNTLTAQITGGSSGGGGGVVTQSLPVTFEETTPPLLTGFGGAEAATIVTDPVSGSGKVAQVVKAAGSEVWAGTTVSTGVKQSIATIPFTATATSMSLRVWSPDAGIPVRLKVENADDDKKSVETEALTTVAGGWQTLVFNFASPVAGTAVLNLTTTYNKASVFFDFGRAGSGKTYYFDDLAFVSGAITPPAPTDYLALEGDSISLVNGTSIASYTMAQFQSDAGISVSWPIPAPMLLKVKLGEVGAYSLPAGQQISAAVSITETRAGGQGELQAYIDKVDIKKTAAGLEISVPSTASAIVYGVSGDGKKNAVIDFSASVAGIKNTLATSSGGSNSIVLGNVIQYAINKVSNDFTGIHALRGKYKVSIVLTDLPLRKADGSQLTGLTITVPTALDSSGAVSASKPVSGRGLVGHITLTD
jgi:hypothetical protein